jgi:hypothetical protein
LKLNPNELKLSCVLIEKDDSSIINSPIISDNEEQLISIENHHHYNDKSSTLILTQQHKSSSSSSLSIKTSISHPVVSPPVTNSAIQIIKNEITDIKKDLDSFKVSLSLSLCLFK